MPTRIFILVLLLLSNEAWSATSTSSIAITVVVPASCTMSFNTPNVSMTFISGFTAAAATTLSIGCTNGANAQLGISSQNNWNLIGSTYGQSIAYTLVYPGGGQTAGATIPSPTWSGGVPNTVVLTGTAAVADWVIPLNIATGVVTNSNKVDIYRDIITFTITY